MDNQSTMPLDWDLGGLSEGLRCYSHQEFFEAHEHWEAVWLRFADPEKTFLQALIQIAASFHHLQRGNPVGAASLLNAALRKLERYPAFYGGVAVEELRQGVHAWVEVFRQGAASPLPPFPRIR